MLAGSLCAGIALLPPLASHDDRFEVHVIQHLLLAMVAPAFLALSAPATLALRTLPRRARRALLRMLHSPAVSVLTAPATADRAPGEGWPRCLSRPPGTTPWPS